MSNQKPHRKKKIPLRSCVICRQKMDKRNLTRIVYNMETGLSIDHSGKVNGRGAYLCQSLDCWQRARQSKMLDQALRVSLSETDKQKLAQ